MVAPSFQSMTVVSEVFVEGGKDYIKVKNEKTGTVRKCRWYSEREYAKLYNKNKSTEVKLTAEQKKFFFPPEVINFEISGANPRTIKAKVAADPRVAKVLLWQACGARLQEQKGA